MEKQDTGTRSGRFSPALRLRRQGGGGPSRDYVEYALRQKDLEGGVKVKMEGPKEFFEEMQEQGGPKHTYVGELYFSDTGETYTYRLW